MVHLPLRKVETQVLHSILMYLILELSLADGSENLRLASQGNGIAGGGGSTLSVDLDGSTLSLSSDGLKASDSILNTSLNSFTK